MNRWRCQKFLSRRPTVRLPTGVIRVGAGGPKVNNFEHNLSHQDSPTPSSCEETDWQTATTETITFPHRYAGDKNTMASRDSVSRSFVLEPFIYEI